MRTYRKFRGKNNNGICTYKFAIFSRNQFFLGISESKEKKN